MTRPHDWSSASSGPATDQEEVPHTSRSSHTARSFELAPYGIPIGPDGIPIGHMPSKTCFSHPLGSPIAMSNRVTSALSEITAHIRPQNTRSAPRRIRTSPPTALHPRHGRQLQMSEPKTSEPMHSSCTRTVTSPHTVRRGRGRPRRSCVGTCGRTSGRTEASTSRASVFSSFSLRASPKV